MNIHLLTIDPQNDFCDPNGSLFVPGADEDMKRLAAMITRVGSKLNDIHVTLDSHRIVDVAHPVFWKNSEGNHPGPFTIISAGDVKNGTWQTTNPGFASRGLDYVNQLEANGRYPLCIWPEHCIIGSWGHGIYPEISTVLQAWERDRFAIVDYVTKGSNLFTEHYSALQADVPDPGDHTTMLNTRLIDILEKTDLVAITGQALSHCVANTVRDIIDNFGTDSVKKLVLLEDTTSNVPGFESLGEDFVKFAVSKGMQVSKSTEFLL